MRIGLSRMKFEGGVTEAHVSFATVRRERERRRAGRRRHPVHLRVGRDEAAQRREQMRSPRHIAREIAHRDHPPEIGRAGDLDFSRGDLAGAGV
ncbi:MAG: hypothetical protein ACFCUS_01775 [Rubrimonas sp.]|uniref:hypothetical protein n=1 Tax=Rubrimonas sp. TaxID=2036015 RepID=UPI002FDDFAA6